jgi:hypothetical protein
MFLRVLFGAEGPIGRQEAAQYSDRAIITRLEPTLRLKPPLDPTRGIVLLIIAIPSAHFLSSTARGQLLPVLRNRTARGITLSSIPPRLSWAGKLLRNLQRDAGEWKGSKTPR